MKTLVRYAIALLAVAVISCNGGGGGEPVGGIVDPALVGRWLLTQMSVDGSAFFSPLDIGWELRFDLRDDGGFSYTEVWQGDTDGGSGTWGATGDQLHLRAGFYDWAGRYEMMGATFRISDVPNYDREGHRGSFTFAPL